MIITALVRSEEGGRPNGNFEDQRTAGKRSEKTTIMEAAEKVGVHILIWCFLKEINEIAACRVCLVELAGIDRLVTACNTECRKRTECHNQQSAAAKDKKDECGTDPFRPQV